MSPKKISNKKTKGFKNIQDLVPKNLIKINPSEIIGNTKSKIENYILN